MSCVTGDGTFRSSNTVSLQLIEKTLLLSVLNCAGCKIGFGCYHSTHGGLGSYGCVLAQIWG